MITCQEFQFGVDFIRVQVEKQVCLVLGTRCISTSIHAEHEYRREANIPQPRSGGFPEGLSARAFDARVAAQLGSKARFKGLTSAVLAVKPCATNSKHAGSALMVNIHSLPSAKSAGLRTLQESLLKTALRQRRIAMHCQTALLPTTLERGEIAFDNIR